MGELTETEFRKAPSDSEWRNKDAKSTGGLTDVGRPFCPRCNDALLSVVRLVEF